MKLTVIEETGSAITLGWTPPAGQTGYVALRDGSELIDGKRRFSFSDTASQVKIGKPQDGQPHTYGVKILGDIAEGVYPEPAPPPPAGAKMVLAPDGTITWDPTVNASSYVIAQVPPTGATLYQTVAGGTRMFKAPARPGLAMEYDVAARFPTGPDVWYSATGGRLKLTWPGVPAPPSPTGDPQLIGIDVGGWDLFATLKQAGVGWFRTNSSGLANIPKGVSAGMRLQSLVVGEGGTLSGIDANTFARDLRTLALKYGPARYEICNEPEGSWFWSDANTTQGAQALARIVKACRASTKDLPGVKLLVSLQPHNGWDDKILAALDPADYDEGIVHPYGGTSHDATSAAGNRQSVIAANQKSGKRIAITEVGWPTAIGKPATGDSAQWTEAEQAANIGSFCQWARANPTIVSMVSYFCGHDYGTNMWYGVIGGDGHSKPGLAELAKWADK